MMNKNNQSTIRFSANGVDYQLPDKPVVVICVDGGDVAYLESGFNEGLLPNLKRFADTGHFSMMQGTMPSFTCPNNMSIVTGVPPSIHGVSGNYYLDPVTGKDIPMTGPELLRCPTILAKCAQAGGRVVSITAKEKLRLQLSKGLSTGGGNSFGNISLSAELASQCTIDENGISGLLEALGMQQPSMYSAELSYFVLQAGLHILKEQTPDLMYLSLTDYVQHKYEPGHIQANLFYKELDRVVGLMDILGAVVALTADHGMNDKCQADGTPNIVFIQDVLDDEFGPDTTQVICPITDAFIKHHGALGGLVRVWLKSALVDAEEVIEFLTNIPGVAMALSRKEACSMFMLPEEYESDVVVISHADYAMGGCEWNHDLSALKPFRLRTHGGLSESLVPLLINYPLRKDLLESMYVRTVHSFETFDLAINGARPSVAPCTSRTLEKIYGN
jgi:phosphonoacetate hydrolase